MNIRGFTLIELLITLIVVSIILTVAIPGFSKHIQDTKTQAAAQAIRNAIEIARSQAVIHNRRTVLTPNEKKWHLGWVLFIDLNNNGMMDGAEKIILQQTTLHKVKVSDTFPVSNQISFIGTGEGRRPGKKNRGEFIAGTIKVCPEGPGDGIKLILNPAGRLRSAKMSAADCAEI